MDYDCVISLIPPYTINTPSACIATLYSFLNDKGIKVYAFDFSPNFYKTKSEIFQIDNPFPFKVNSFALLGYALWLFNANQFFDIDNIGNLILKSLSPIHIDLYDFIFDQLKKKIPLFNSILDKYSDKLLSFNTNNYCFSINITNAIATLKVIEKIKKHKPKSNIILGGPEVFDIYRCDLYISSELIDYVIYHFEGEIPFYKIIKTLKEKNSLDSVPGLALKQKNTIFKTKKPPNIDLNKSPLPKYGQLDYDNLKFDEFNKLELLISKGCTGHCLFCNEPSIWNPFKSKSPLYIKNEIEHYINYFNIDKFEISDNAFNTSDTFLRALKTIKNDKYKLKFGGNCRLNKITSKSLSLYKEHGLTHCFYGLESASQYILDLMRKDLNIQEASNIMKLGSKLDISSILYLMVGFPGERDSDITLTEGFLENNKDYINDIYLSVFTLMNKSPIFYSNLLKPIQLGPKILNCYDYESTDGITHEIRSERFIKLKTFWNSIQKI